MSPLVSVIIPNYNHAAFLQQRIDSVLTQSYKNFEVILLDDCSTDDSVLILEPYRQHEKVKYLIINNVNSGSPFTQWHKGITLSTGELIWIAESDDFADTSFLQNAVKKYQEVSGLNLFFSNCARVNETGSVEGSYDNWFLKTPKLDFTRDFIISGEALVKDALQISNIVINASGVVFRKAAIRKFFDHQYQKFNYCGDWYFWAEIVQGGMVAYTALKLNYFRFHKQTTRAAKPVLQQVDYYIECCWYRF